MPVPFENTTSLPSDANGQIYWGLWDRILQVYHAVSGRVSGAMFISKERGTGHTANVTATTSSGALLAANTARISASFFNNGAVNVYIEDNGAATVTSQVVPPGCLFVDDEGTNAWTVIAASSTAVVGVREVY